MQKSQTKQNVAYATVNVLCATADKVGELV